jgi:homoserine dehydrogenase
MMRSTKKRIILCGLGTVGKAFARLLQERRARIAKKYGLDIEIAAAVDLGGAAVAGQGALPLDDLLVHLDAGGAVEAFSPYGRPGLSGVEAVSSIPAEVLVETTPTNLVDGEPARGHIFAALNHGLDIVSANKGPLVLFTGNYGVGQRQGLSNFYECCNRCGVADSGCGIDLFGRRKCAGR